MRTTPTATRRLAGEVHCSSATPIGTPTAPPSRNGISRAGLRDRRSFHTEMPCSMSPKATINAVVWVGDRKYSHAAAATIPKAKPATPATNAAAKVAAANSIRRKVERSVIAHPIVLAAILRGGDRATLGRQVAEGWLPMTWPYYAARRSEVN